MKVGSRESPTRRKHSQYLGRDLGATPGSTPAVREGLRSQRRALLLARGVCVRIMRRRRAYLGGKMCLCAAATYLNVRGARGARRVY